MKPEEITQYMGVLNQGLADLATKLQQPAEKIFELFIRQNYVRGVIGIFQIIALVIITILAVNFLKWGLSKPDEEIERYRFEESEGVFVLIIVVFVFVCFLWIVVFFGGFEEVISRFINPEYMALKDIVEMIKK